MVASRTATPDPTMPHLPRNLMLALSLAQGVALLLLWRAAADGTWPSRTPMAAFPLWIFAVVWPGLILLGLEAGNKARLFKLVSLFCAVLMPLAAYMGWQATPAGEFPIGSLVGIGIATTLIACFKALMYLQQWAGGRPTDYDALFACSWRNFLVAGLAAAVTFGVHAVLYLWGLLFSAIGIEFFRELFGRDWFLFPVLAVAFGVGVLIFRRLVNLIDGITGLLEGLMRLLLPLAVAVVTVFLATLPFTGLAPLWETGNGTELLLWLNALVLFSVNAVYQTGRDAPYPPAVHRALCPGVALLPVLCALALYGLSLRVGQYGWSVERCWAMTVCALLAMFSTGYAWCIVRRRGDWPQSLGRVNRTLGWVVLALMLLVNSPLLDFRSISLASQLRRVDTGEIDLRDFDFHYARHHLARPAWLRMQAFIDAYEHTNPELARLIREPMPPAPARISGADDVWARVVYRPERFEVPAGVRAVVSRFFVDPYSPRSRNFMSGESGVHHELPFLVSRPGDYHDPVLVRVDMNGDGEPEYALIVGDRERDHAVGLCIYRNGGGWSSFVLAMRERLPEGTDLAQSIEHGDVAAVPPAFRDLKLGALILGGM